MVLHHLMVGTWVPPGAIFTLEFDDENLTLTLIKKTPIPEAEPISWMTFDVSVPDRYPGSQRLTWPTARPEKHLWRRHEEMVKLCRPVSNRDHP